MTQVKISGLYNGFMTQIKISDLYNGFYDTNQN